MSSDLRTFETTCNLTELKDQFAGLLYTLKIVKEDEEIDRIDFGDFGTPRHNNEVPLKFTIKKRREANEIN